MNPLPSVSLLLYESDLSQSTCRAGDELNELSRLCVFSFVPSFVLVIRSFLSFFLFHILCQEHPWIRAIEEKDRSVDAACEYARLVLLQQQHETSP